MEHGETELFYAAVGLHFHTNQLIRVKRRLFFALFRLSGLVQLFASLSSF